MKSGQLDGEIGSIVHDLLIDAIDNDSEQVWSGIIRTPHDDYPVKVNYFHGVYWVWAMECDPVGYFLDQGAAVDFASSEWGDAALSRDTQRTSSTQGRSVLSAAGKETGSSSSD
jgi:hypothetical protein